MTINLLSNIFRFFKNISQEYQIVPSKNSDFSELLISYNDPNSYISEQYRSLASYLLRSPQLKHSKSFLFTSPQPRDGKSTTVSNLGIVLARDFGKKILLIDADLYRPTLHSLFNKENENGLAEVLLGSSELLNSPIKIMPNLDLMRAGKYSPEITTLITTEDNLSEKPQPLIDKYDLVLFDTPPILKVSDAGVFASVADKLLLVVRAQSTPQDLIVSAKEALISHNVMPAGVVLVNHRRAMDLYNYTVNSHYRDYYSDFYKGYSKKPDSISK
jgi:capsular exopolysaccharide synthesis family protein